MRQHQFLQRVLFFSAVVLFVAPMSMFADERPEWRTKQVRPNVNDRRGGDSDLQGTVVSVRQNGDEFILRTRRGEVRVDARGGVPAYYNGRRYRIRDLERGDQVAVDLISSSRGGYRARSVEVLRSVSHDGRYGDGRYGGYDPYDRDDRYGEYGSDGRNGGYGRYERIAGQVVSFEGRRDVMILRTSSRQQIAVDIGRVRNRTSRAIRIGDWLELEGTYDGRTFIADRISNSRGY
jgi:hypothetical protein